MRLASPHVEGLQLLEAEDLWAVMVTYRDALRLHQEEINRLNVYPVPDGDTGTNMALTLESVVSELAKADGRGAPTGDRGASDGGRRPAAAVATNDGNHHLADVCRAISHGSLMGARGNSGVILSQILRGIAEGFHTSAAAGPRELAKALVSASGAADRAVMRPVEGTILTVAREAGTAAEQTARTGASLVEVAGAARASAAEALARTPDLLPPLKQAGVVDAGGAGFLLLLDALLNRLDGRAFPDVPELHAAALRETASGFGGANGDAGHGAGPGGQGVDSLRYEVMYLLDCPDASIDAFKDVWAGIGDSIVVVGGDGLWNCHIHTDDIGSAIEAGLDAGRPRDVRVTDLREQVDEERWVREGGALEPADEEDLGPEATTAVVAVAVGEGIRRIFRSLGVHRTVRGGQTMNPSTQQILEAVESVPSSSVIVLPNNKNIRPVAEQVDALTAKTVRVVPTEGVPEGFAALMAYDPEAAIDENATRMTAAARRVVPISVTQAVRDAVTPAGRVSQGQWLALTRDGIAVVAEDLADAVCRALDAVLGDASEIVTLIEGEGAGAGTTRQVTEWLHDAYKDISVEVHHGGQPLYPYLISVE